MTLLAGTTGGGCSGASIRTVANFDGVGIRLPANGFPGVLVSHLDDCLSSVGGHFVAYDLDGGVHFEAGCLGDVSVPVPEDPADVIAATASALGRPPVRECAVNVDGRMQAVVLEQIPVREAPDDVLVGIVQRVARVDEWHVEQVRPWLDLAECVSDLVWSTDAEGRLTYASRRAPEILGRRPERLRGERFAAVVDAGDRDPFVLASGQMARPLRDLRAVASGSGGVRRQLSLWAIPIMDREGRTFIGYRGIARDVTVAEEHGAAVIRAAQAAEAATRAKAHFLAHVSHELRTPLNAIIGFSEAMRMEAIGPIGTPRYREYAGDIIQSANDLLAKVEAILDATRAQRGELILEEGSVSVDEVVRGALSLVPDSRAFDARIQVGLPRVRGDARRLTEALGELLLNAVKFTPADARIGLTVAALPEGGIELVVWDRGKGISVKDLPHIFEPFWLRDAGIARTHRGIGLGLPLAYEIARLHDGDLVLESEDGRGTRAILSIPAERVQEG